METILAKGAEATIIKKGTSVIKERLVKTYRLEEIDSELRKTRTKKEAKILKKLEGIAPKLIHSDDESKLEIEYVDGDVVKNILDDQIDLAIEIGKNTATMHDQDIIHGDLTTSNMILDKKGKLKFIDFGLSFVSDKEEDKAVDLHLFKEAVESKHFRKEKEIWDNFIKGYNPKDKKRILKRLEIVETRGRNKQKY